MTIGYGDYVPQYSCFGGLFTVFAQALSGVILDAMFMGMISDQRMTTGIIFQRLARPYSRQRSVMFAKTPVIHTMDGVKRLVVRVGNLRHSQVCCN